MGHAVDEALRLNALGQGGHQPVGIEEQGQVDVAGIVQLIGPELAHGETEQAGDGASRVVFGRDQPTPGALFDRDCGQGDAGRGVGEARQGVGHGDEVPDAAQIGQGGQQVQVGLQGPQRGLQGFGRSGQRRGLGQEDRQPRLGVDGQDPAQPLG